MMNIDEKKKLALEVIARLKQAYPDAACSLDYNEAWKLLVSVRLAAQCTDARVNMIVPKLYEKFPDVNALADAPVEEIEEIVRPCGLGKSKARDISAKDPKKVEMALWKIIPPEEGNDLCHRFVLHGRDICSARTTPHCEHCCLQDICAQRI